MIEYYTKVKKINPKDLDAPQLNEHTMSHSLQGYVESKLPVGELEGYLKSVKKFEIHGIYPDLKIISGLDLGFRILKTIYVSVPKKDNSNSLRPIFLLAERDSERVIVCCVTPGRDLLLHYASMVNFILRSTDVALSVYAYPLAEKEIDRWTGLDEPMVYKDDVVILGYSTFFKESFSNDKDFSLLTVNRNKFYTSSRFLGRSGIVVNCLEANYGHWGNISDYLSQKICRLGASEIIHIGKVGTFTSPLEIYKRMYIPNKFVVGRRSEILYAGNEVSNSMNYIEEHLSLAHVSVATTMEETFAQREVFDSLSIETIDIESSKIAQAVGLYNSLEDRQVKFGAIHFSSDYLRRSDEISESFEFDLSTKRIPKVKDRKMEILSEIFGIIRGHLLFFKDEEAYEKLLPMV
jgi:hypothetical protein